MMAGRATGKAQRVLLPCRALGSKALPTSHLAVPHPNLADAPRLLGLALLLLACCAAPSSRAQATGFLSGSLPLSALITTPVELARAAPGASVTLSSRQALQARRFTAITIAAHATTPLSAAHNNRGPLHGPADGPLLPCIACRWSFRGPSSPWAPTLAQRPILAAGQVAQGHVGRAGWQELGAGYNEFLGNS